MLIVVTNRKLCRDDFLQRIDLLAKGKPNAIMLREKDLSLVEYEDLARKVNEICVANRVPIIINQNISIAEKLMLPNIHLSLPVLRNYKNEKLPFLRIGASVHSVSEAVEAQELGASYVVAGHIFSTDCKKGVPPKGLSFLTEVCNAVTIPVFAIGGISQNNLKQVAATGANGWCIMSQAMTCENPENIGSVFR